MENYAGTISAHIAEIIAFVISFVYGYSRLNSKVEDGEKDIKKLLEFSKEFFERIEKLEIQKAVQEQINANMSEHWKRIETKLDSIEAKLDQMQSRRQGDGKQWIT